ncbi:MAG: hypothetical protein ABS920_15200 [Sporosarcina sp.]
MYPLNLTDVDAIAFINFENVYAKRPISRISIAEGVDLKVERQT